MDALQQYVISAVTAAILCGILTGILPKGTAQELIKLICGAFLALTLIRPVLSLKHIELPDFGLSFSREAAQAAAQGENYSAQALGAVIKAETESYILDKAEEMHLSIRAEVRLNGEDPPLPEEVRLHGDAAPAAKQKLVAILSEDLGIAKENLIWIG